jgi:hypothetical protein
MLIRILDITASVLTVVSLNLVMKSYRWWILYSLASVCFIIVCFSNHIPGLTLMGIFLLVTGIKNYIVGRKGVK